VAKIDQFKQRHPAAEAAAAAAAAAALTAAAAAAVVALEEMRDEKLALDADKRRTVTLLNAVKARFLFCRGCC
jgi:H+/Cl- antiporter ClcA